MLFERPTPQVSWVTNTLVVKQTLWEVKHQNTGMRSSVNHSGVDLLKNLL